MLFSIDKLLVFGRFVVKFFRSMKPWVTRRAKMLVVIGGRLLGVGGIEASVQLLLAVSG
jgi:hypothetical protein